MRGSKYFISPPLDNLDRIFEKERRAIYEAAKKRNIRTRWLRNSYADFLLRREAEAAQKAALTPASTDAPSANEGNNR